MQDSAGAGLEDNLSRIEAKPVVRLFIDRMLEKSFPSL